MEPMGNDAAQLLLLWDVDHTLIENSGVSKENYALAFELLTGRPPDVQPQTDGRTDQGIMTNLLAGNGENPDAYSLERQWNALLKAGKQNKAALAERGYALPGATACLERISGVAEIHQSVLTGNLRPNAVIKLQAFGLDKWIDWEVGGFGSDDSVRARLVPVAQARAKERYGFDPSRNVTLLVGDTPLDVEAGVNGGARVIAVATGAFSRQELEATEADAVLDDLADVDAFMNTLTSVRELGPVTARL